MRLIPGKTKVRVELFRGVTLGDIVVGAVAVLMLILVLVSNLPWKLPICIAIGVVAVMLVIRLDEQPNYIYLLHILSYFGYHRRFARAFSDGKLYERTQAEENDPDKGLPEKKPARKETAAERKKRLKEEERSQRLARRVTEKARKAAEKEKQQERRREDKLLRSRKTPEDVKEEIRLRRA